MLDNFSPVKKIDFRNHYVQIGKAVTTQENFTPTTTLNSQLIPLNNSQINPPSKSFGLTLY